MNLNDAAALSPELGSGITISGLTKKFLIGRETLTALDNATLHSDRGSFLSLLGPSGCGKSTILRILAGLETATEGFVTVDGKSPAELRKNHELGIAFQDSALMPWRSVEDNIRLPLELSGKKPEASQLADLIKLVGLQGFEKAKPAQLSGGMRQRVSIARALVVQPSVLLLDEPTNNLDPASREEILRALATFTGAVVLVSHDEGAVLALNPERVLILPDGVEDHWNDGYADLISLS
jgi:NitT/TauT family transport system ATP-binding protein